MKPRLTALLEAGISGMRTRVKEKVEHDLEGKARHLCSLANTSPQGAQD